MEEKTILQWFEQAKAEGLEWADAAIKNIEYPSWNVNSMYKALEMGFVWSDTPQGFSYWCEIAESFKK